ncbi:MAG: glycosyltransferase family 4 protein [Cyclobacteriaceae bacterium]|nr:glycosyltransferase family 4 protein [Cyclobacteriaceae bacterium]
MSSEFPPAPGGIGNHAFNLAKGLAYSGSTVEVFTFISKYGVNLDGHKFLVNYVRSGFLHFLLVLLRKVRKFGDRPLVIIVSGRRMLISAYLLSFFISKRILLVGIIHGTDINPSGILMKMMVNLSLAKFNKLISVSRFTAGLIPLKFQDKVWVINNGFDDSFFFCDRLSVKSIPLKIITTGSVTDRKGQRNVIAALPEIVKRLGPVQYHIVGIPVKAKELLMYADELGVKSSITIHGAVSAEALRVLLSESHIFAMLSNSTITGSVEGFGIAILEANAMGLPAIGSIGCGIEDAIANDYSGILVDPLDSIEVADAIEKIWRNFNVFQKNSLDHAKKFSWSKISEQYLQALAIP